MSERYEFLKRRVGRFQISIDELRRNAERVEKLMSNMVVTKAEYRFDIDAIEYMALCEEFTEIERGMEAPFYHRYLHENGSFSWERRE